MPDWTYRTLFRPALFRLPIRFGRDGALASIGRLARLPGGRRLIEFMGHMRPPHPLHRKLGNTAIDSPVGLAPGIDPHLTGLPGVCRFGFGFLEIGPVTVAARPERRTLRDDPTEAISLEPADANPGLARVASILKRLPSPRPAIIIRLGHNATSGDDERVMNDLRAHAAAFSIPLPERGGQEAITCWLERVQHTVSVAAGRPVLAVVPVNASDDAFAMIDAARHDGAAGAIMGRAELRKWGGVG